MSYESRVFKELSLPNRDKVIRALLLALFRHNGYATEFGSGNAEFVNEIADSLGLSPQQRSFLMQTIVQKKEG